VEKKNKKNKNKNKKNKKKRRRWWLVRECLDFLELHVPREGIQSESSGKALGCCAAQATAMPTTDQKKLAHAASNSIRRVLFHDHFT
jgi:hypothetical protein